MSIFEQIRKTAQNAAKEGLERLGLNLSHVDVPDDDDTKPRDFFELYREIVEKSQERTRSLAVPVTMRDGIREFVQSRCGQNREVMAILEAWFDDRRSFFKSLSSMDAASEEDLYSEAMQILLQSGIIQIPGDGFVCWTETAQSIAKCQCIPACNLILQSCRQFADDGDAALTFDVWCSEMNSRLERFGYRIEFLHEKWMSIMSVPLAEREMGYGAGDELD